MGAAVWGARLYLLSRTLLEALPVATPFPLRTMSFPNGRSRIERASCESAVHRYWNVRVAGERAGFLFRTSRAIFNAAVRYCRRDGTIIVGKHYLSVPDGVELLPNAVAGLKRLREFGLGAVVDQQSIRGRPRLLRSRCGQDVNARMTALLSEAGVQIDAVYICPHKPDDRCHYRRP